jgi:hypothetical protein
MTTKPYIEPKDARFIKLGEGGRWEQSCLDIDQVIRLGYNSPMHDASMASDWEAVTKYWLGVRDGKTQTASNDVRQIRDFYEAPTDTLWFTFNKRMLWWCFAESNVTQLSDLSRVRKVRGTWSHSDINGKPLTVQTLDGRLTKVIGYRGTICGLDPEIFEYLVRKINGKKSPDVVRAESQVTDLLLSLEALIRGLWWKDFELLADLIFAKSGWQRVSVLGQTDKDIDLDLEAPVTGKKAFVQVKSYATIETLHSSISQFKSMGQFDEFYFVFHTGAQLSAFRSDDPRIQIVDVQRLAGLVLNAGLSSWLISKRA